MHPWPRASHAPVRHAGRRVLVRSRAVLCSPTPVTLDARCRSKIRRTVWDGDHELGEIQYPGDDAVSAAQLERDTVTITPDGRLWRRVVYTHGLDVDRPLGILRMGYTHPTSAGYAQFDNVAVTPHYNWRGLPDLDSYVNGAATRCTGTGSAQQCVELVWPSGFSAFQQQFYRPSSWFGTLPEQKMEVTGQAYRRNRYYDPHAGRFTQEDPIGLAGGLNLYGFADGDPVNYADPYGLCPVPATNCPPGYFTGLGATSGLVAGITIASGCAVGS
ncbi:MAG: RHS repeat-associated core domain-containing protein [Gemmatimonadaceae bacterium]